MKNDLDGVKKISNDAVALHRAISIASPFNTMLCESVLYYAQAIHPRCRRNAVSANDVTGHSLLPLSSQRWPTQRFHSQTKSHSQLALRHTQIP